MGNFMSITSEVEVAVLMLATHKKLIRTGGPVGPNLDKYRLNIEDWRARFKQCECEAALEPIERIATGLSKLGEEDLIAMIKDVDEETANALKALLDANREEKEEAASGAKDSRV